MSEKINNQPTLAVAIIVKNEANHLDACLKTVHDWVDEIVIVDSGSADQTKNIAKKYTNKFYTHDNWMGFGHQRQITQQYVESDFILWLDADERVTPELKESILTAVSQNLPDTVYKVCRLSWVFGKFIYHCGWYPDRVVRLYPTKLTQYNNALVHEKVELSSNIKQQVLAGDALHYTYDDLHHYLVKSAGYAQAWAKQREMKGKKSSLAKGVSHAFFCFIRMYLLKAGFLDGKQGLLLCLLSAHSTFIKYADLWIKTNTAKPKS